MEGMQTNTLDNSTIGNANLNYTLWMINFPFWFVASRSHNNRTIEVSPSFIVYVMMQLCAISIWDILRRYYAKDVTYWDLST